MISDIEDYVGANRESIDQQPTYNNMTNSKVALQLDKNAVEGQVKRAIIGNIIQYIYKLRFQTYVELYDLLSRFL